MNWSRLSRTFSTVFTFIILNTLAFSQEHFYYTFGGKKIPLTISTEKISMKFMSDATLEQVQSVFSAEPALGDSKPLLLASMQGFSVVHLAKPVNMEQLVQRLRNRPEVAIVNPVFFVEDSLEIILYDRFAVKFDLPVPLAKIDSLNNYHHVEIVRELEVENSWYTFRIMADSDLSVLKMSNLYYESLLSEWSVPDFLTKIDLHYTPNDPYFAEQYYFHNTGQTGGVYDADINAPAAWNISKGSSDIVVAILDGGVTAHEDLPAGRIVSGHDYVDDDNDPSPGGNANHGMACAGIIAATHNSIGVAGLAPNVKIMPLRLFDEWGHPATIEKFAYAINFAWQHGADVISNSWGISSTDPDYFPRIVDAINEALMAGRGGKGCVVVFSAGNKARRDQGNYGYVNFPAMTPGVLVVGASDKSNQIQNYSPRSAEIDIVAPSGALSVYDHMNRPCKSGAYFRYGDVWTIDIAGAPGYNTGQYGIEEPTCYTEYLWDSPGGDPYPPGNYTATFGGTSAACPQVAGIAALMLSRNPFLDGKLSHPEVQDIIKATATAMGSGQPNQDFGWGRANAYSALVSTPLPVTISGPHSLDYKEYGIFNANVNGGSGPFEYQWYRKDEGGSWSTRGTSQSQTERMIRTSFNMKVVVTIGGDNAEDTHFVEYWRDGGGGGDPRPKTMANVPEEYALHQNYPNPFNPVATIQYDLPKASNVTLVVYDIISGEVARLVDAFVETGYHKVQWNGRDQNGNSVPSGIYIARLVTSEYSQSIKMVLLK